MMPQHIRQLSAIRRRAWILVAFSLVGQIAETATTTTTHFGAALAMTKGRPS